MIFLQLVVIVAQSVAWLPSTPKIQGLNPQKYQILFDCHLSKGSGKPPKVSLPSPFGFDIKNYRFYIPLDICIVYTRQHT